VDAMRKIRWLAFVLLLLSLSACGTSEKRAAEFAAQLDAFVGQSIDEVIKANGVPTGTAALSSGGRVVEYSKSKLVTSGGGAVTTFQNVYVPGPSGGSWTTVPVQTAVPISMSERNCKILFTVSKDNLVENWKAVGNSCY
jgi:hypothetical protein